MKNLPPPPPNFAPEQIPMPRDSRYQRPRRIFSLWGLVIGIVLGLAGGLFYAWQIAPVREFDTQPRQLNVTDKSHYVVAVALRFAQDSDLNRAVNALVALNLGTDPFQAVADIACQLASTGYVDSTSGIRAIRTLKTFYQLQGKTGCAEALIDDATPVGVVTLVIPTNTPTLAPPPSKTPTPESGLVTPTPSGVVIVPTTRPSQKYEARIVNTFCDVELSGVIEVFVQDTSADGVPGQQVRVRWDDGESLFSTGLKPERGSGYADFTMTLGFNYTIDMPAQSDPLAQPLIADACITPNGEEAVTSYRVAFTLSG